MVCDIEFPIRIRGFPNEIRHWCRQCRLALAQLGNLGAGGLRFDSELGALCLEFGHLELVFDRVTCRLQKNEYWYRE